MSTNGSTNRVRLALVDAEPLENGNDQIVLRDEKRLKMVTDRLADALEDFEKALHAGAEAELGPRMRSMFEDLLKLQEEASRALGRAVGDRIATANRWRVRRGIEVADPGR